MKALLSEIDAQAPLYSDFCVQTVFFGGGTPSLLTEGQTAAVLERLYQRFSFVPGKEREITLEANPGTLTAEKLRSWRASGVNRLSIGLQSAHDDELKALGRIHTWREFLSGYEAARQAGFSNLNIDLMSALPGQSVESWMDTLKKTADLGPEHISAYSLIIEEETPFFDWYGTEEDAGAERTEPDTETGAAEAAGHPLPSDRKPLPTEEEDRLMYERTGEFLKERGYERYEISNYARPAMPAGIIWRTGNGRITRVSVWERPLSGKTCAGAIRPTWRNILPMRAGRERIRRSGRRGCGWEGRSRWRNSCSWVSGKRRGSARKPSGASLGKNWRRYMGSLSDG